MQYCKRVSDLCACGRVFVSLELANTFFSRSYGSSTTSVDTRLVLRISLLETGLSISMRDDTSITESRVLAILLESAKLSMQK